MYKAHMCKIDRKHTEVVCRHQMALAARFTEDFITEIGLDEAGRGSFWGPLTAGAVVIPLECTEEQQLLVAQLRDSKKISPKKRVTLAQKIRELLPLSAVGMVHAAEINQHGIQWANVEAFRRAMMGLSVVDVSACRLLVDGTLPVDTWAGEQHVIVEGDNQYMAIAAASILAKVSHDQWIEEYAEVNPACQEQYDIVHSKGYGTAKHRAAIQLYGGHELHRDAFIQNWLPGVDQATRVKKSKKKEGCLIRF